MRILILSVLGFSIFTFACDKKSSGPEAPFPSVVVDAYYSTGGYNDNTVYIIVYNNSDEMFHCSVEGNIFVHLPETTIVYPDTTVYSPSYPYDPIDVAGGSVTYPDTLLEIPVDFSYLHINSEYYSSIYTYFADNIVQYGYYEYTQYGQTQYDYAFTRTWVYSSIDVEVTLEDPRNRTQVYYLSDIGGS